MPTDRTSQSYRDRHGRTLTDYPRPSVAVDTALLTLLNTETGQPELGVLQVRQNRRGWSLPGTFIHEGERLIDAVQRALRDKAGVTGLAPRQLQVFDDPQRDNRGWVLSVAHIDVVAIHRLNTRSNADTRIAPADRPGRLPHGHNDIIALAVRDLRQRYTTTPDPDHLLPDTFTLRELRHAHQAIAGHTLQRDTFRRTMEPAIQPTGNLVTRGPGRPAELFTRAPHNPHRP